jgi:hypothetical protein
MSALLQPAVPVRFTITSKPCHSSWLMVVSTDDGPAGGVRLRSVRASSRPAPAAREVRRFFSGRAFLEFSCGLCCLAPQRNRRSDSVRRSQ